MEDFSVKLQMEEAELLNAKTEPHEEATLGKLDSVSIIVFSFSCMCTYHKIKNLEGENLGETVHTKK